MSDRPPHTELVPRGPVFVSYRQSDGTPLAVELAAALRAFGIPVWQDATDLPPGDTKRRLKEALDSGLSGAVLVVTSEISKSSVVKDIELPALLQLEADTDFIFLVASSITSPEDPTRLAYDAPDRVLGRTDGRLSGIKQFPIVGSDAVISIAKAVCLQRMATLRRTPRSSLDLHIQTRLAPRADHGNADLIVRLPTPPGPFRSPPAQAWPYFAAFLNWLPQLVAELGVSELSIRGGAHLSAAYALGASLPITSGCALSVLGADGKVWGPSTNAAPIALSETTEKLPGLERAGVFVDLVPTAPPVDAFGSHLKANPSEYIAAIRISQPSRAQVPTSAAVSTAAEIADRIRRFAADVSTAKADLFLRTPFPIAVQLGRHLNTLEARLFEWEDGIEPPEYRPSVRVASGRGNSPIVAIEAANLDGAD